MTNATETTYSKPFAVQVNDANGAAVANQVVTLSVFPTSYLKGFLSFGSSVWGYSSSGFVSCANEDVNRDGTLQAGEDTNGNTLLTPGLPGVVAPASVTTDASGFASFNLLYGENQAPWVVFEITARAVVAGTESRSLHSYLAGGTSEDFSDETIPPAGLRSPYGIVLSCTSPN